VRSSLRPARAAHRQITQKRRQRSVCSQTGNPDTRHQRRQCGRQCGSRGKVYQRRYSGSRRVRLKNQTVDSESAVRACPAGYRRAAFRYRNPVVPGERYCAGRYAARPVVPPGAATAQIASQTHAQRLAVLSNRSTRRVRAVAYDLRQRAEQPNEQKRTKV